MTFKVGAHLRINCSCAKLYSISYIKATHQPVISLLAKIMMKVIWVVEVIMVSRAVLDEEWGGMPP